MNKIIRSAKAVGKTKNIMRGIEQSKPSSLTQREDIFTRKNDVGKITKTQKTINSIFTSKHQDTLKRPIYQSLLI